MRKLPRSKCLFCNKECKRATTKFCSPECYVNYRKENNIRIGGPKLTITPRACNYCNVIFMPNNYKQEQKYCTRRCMGLARADECRKLGYSRKGIKPSIETRNKMSMAASKRMANSTYTKGRGGYRKDIKHYVRSRWEANIARILNYESIDYEYEPDTFVLILENDKELRYRPDFKLEKHYIEVKGWWDLKSKRIKQLMNIQYPEILIEYISEKEYSELSAHYSNVIPKWERR